MLGRLLHLFGSVHVACEILILLHSIRRFVKSSGKIEDKISALPDDLLVKILLLLPTKDAVATAILSKRWRSVWTMLPQLVYMDSDYKQRLGNKESIWWFIDQSLQLHKAHVLESLVIELGPGCPVNVDVGKWIPILVDRRVRRLQFGLSWLSEPIMLHESLYICKTLVCLSIFDKVFVDVPSLVCLPSLEDLRLSSVVYKDEDALVRLLSGCRVLKQLYVRRLGRDNLKNISVKVPSLKTFCYDYMTAKDNVGSMGGSLVIDSASLRTICLQDVSGNSYSIENKPRLDKARISVFCYLDDKFRRSLSSVMFLDFILNPGTVGCCNTINFSQLIECKINPYNLDWLSPFMCLLQNSPKLRVLLIDQTALKNEVTFNQPSSVPECLSNHLEIFEWEEYGGRDGEKEVVRYILANSKCLKRAGIAIEPTCNRKKMMKELESMSRVSTSSQLLFATQFKIEISLQATFSD